MSRTPDELHDLGQLWLTGARVEWSALWAGQTRRRVPLPTYPFERQRYWIEPALAQAAHAWPEDSPVRSGGRREPRVATRGYHPRPRLSSPYVGRRAPRPSGGWPRSWGRSSRRAGGLYDSFFDLGGDSLLATSLVSRLNGRSGSSRG